MPSFRLFEDLVSLSRAAAAEWVLAAHTAIAARGRFTIALAGGSTPKKLYQDMASDAFRSEVAWDKVHVFWGDERCVPPDHADSNYRMAKEALLDHVPIPAQQIYRIEAERADVADAAADYEKTAASVYAVKPGGPPPSFDLVLLGMGPDGHTASLFPGTKALGEKTAWVAANWVAKFNTNRITMTYPLLNAAQKVIFLVGGADKADVLVEVLQGAKDIQRLPSQGIQPEAGECTWLVDKAAAAKLQK